MLPTPPFGAMTTGPSALTAPVKVTCAPVTSSEPTLTGLRNEVRPAPVLIVKPGAPPNPVKLWLKEMAPPPV